MVKITDGKTPPATKEYESGWERVFGEKERVKVKCYHRNWLYQEDGQAVYGRYTKDCPDCNGTGEYFITKRKEEDGSNL